MERRHFLQLLVSTAIAGHTLPSGAAEQSLTPTDANPGGSTPPLPWRNWSGSQQSVPARRVAPRSIGELQELLTASDNRHRSVRPVGSGHSFSALVPTDGILVSLARLSGVLDHDDTRCQARVAAGTLLGQLGQPLEAIDQALFNMPDIDQQSLAGLLATATHGTGETKRPPKIPKWPRSSGSSIFKSTLDTINLVNKCLYFAGVFNAFCGFYATTNVDSKGLYLLYS